VPAQHHERAREPASGARRLYLLRHGEAAPAENDGPAADPWAAPLTPRGRAQVADLAVALAGLRLDLLVTSMVPRAVETAEILARRIGLVPLAEEGLNELRPGRVLAGSPEAVRLAVRQAYRDAGLPGARFLGGEPFTAFGQRVEQALARILARPGWTRAAVVTHEPALRHVLARCQGLGLAGLDAFEAATASVSILDCAPGVIALEGATLRLANGTGDQAMRLP
jgi:probable phosphoglycerate mutase